MSTRPLPNLEHDYRVFLWFLTLTTCGMYIWAVNTSPTLQQNPGLLVLCTVLLIIYTTLHWFIDRIYRKPGWWTGYVLLQGALAFTITLMTNILVMNFALFLALIGESIGVWGLSRRSLLTIAYYLVLSLATYWILYSIYEMIWWIVAIVPTLLFIAIYVTLYNRQAEANDRARELLAELQSANRQLSEYAVQVEDLTIATERQRMARELHDTLSQGLAGLILQLEAADAYLTQDHPEKARQIVQQTMQRARVTLGEARLAIDNLRSAAAPTLEEILRQEVDRFRAAAEIDCSLDIDLGDELTPEQRDAIARIIPEALTNIRYHAQASRVWVQLCGDDSEVRLRIEDNGVGFDPAATPPGHYGLLGIRERTHLAGGELTIQSKPGEGTQLMVHFPRAAKQA